MSKINNNEIYAIQERLNNRPRKKLNYLTPNSTTFARSGQIMGVTYVSHLLHKIPQNLAPAPTCPARFAREARRAGGSPSQGEGDLFHQFLRNFQFFLAVNPHGFARIYYKRVNF